MSIITIWLYIDIKHELNTKKKNIRGLEFISEVLNQEVFIIDDNGIKLI